MTAKKQRVVILPGPHKTGSSSVQGYLSKLMKNEQLGHFAWPARYDKAFAPLASFIVLNNTKNIQLIQRKRQKIARLWEDQKSIVIGAELLDYVATLSSEERTAAFERLHSLLPQDDNDVTPESVVMYRTPRTSHLVSGWKQQLVMASKGHANRPWRFELERQDDEAALTTRQNETPSLAQWLCRGRWEGEVGMGFYIEKILTSQVNPIGIADAFYREGRMNVTVADMSGIDDLPNAVACEILNLSCSDNNKVVGHENEDALVLYRRSNPTSLGFNDEEMEQVEETLRMMDCSYYCALRNGIAIFHAKDEMFMNEGGWKGCCETPEKWLSPAQAYAELKRLACRASGDETPPQVTNAPQLRQDPPDIEPMAKPPVAIEAVAQPDDQAINLAVKESAVRAPDAAVLAFPGFAAFLLVGITVAASRILRRRRLTKET